MSKPTFKRGDKVLLGGMYGRVGVEVRTHLAFMQATRMESRCKPAFGCECGRAVHECACQACARTVATKEDALRTYAATGRIPDMKEET